MGQTIKRIDNWSAGMSDLVIMSLLVVVPLVWDMDTLYPTGPGSKNLFLAYGAAVALAFAGAHLLLTSRTVSIRPAQGALIVFGLYLFARALFDPRPDFAMGTAAPHLGAIAVALVISYMHKGRLGLRRHFAALTVATGIAVVYAVSQIFDYDLLFRLIYHREGTWHHPLFEEERAVVFSTFGNPNYFAHFLGPVILLVLAPALGARRWFPRVAWWSAFAVMLVVVFRTYNRGIWLGLMVGGVIWVACLLFRYTLISEGRSFRSSCFRPKVIGVVLILIVAAIAAVVWLPVFEPLIERFRTGFLLRDTSVRSRLLFWLVALLMWRLHPWFGIGMGRYDARFLDELLELAQGPQGDMLRNLTPKMVSLRAVYAHNDYVQFLAEWGAVGFGLFLLVILLVLAAAIRVVRRDLSRPSSIFLPSAALCAAYGSFLIQLAYDFPLHLPSSELLFFFLIGAILVFERESCCQTQQSKLSRRVICVLVGLVLLGPWVWSLRGISANLSASHHLFHGQNNALAGREQIADREYEIAARLDPENGEISFCRAVNFVRMGRIPKALDQYDLSLETHQTTEYYYQLGMAHLARRDYSRAMRHLDKLITINPRKKNANFALGLCHFHNPFGPDYNRAAELFAREVDQYPDDPKSLTAWLSLGESKWNLGDLSGARDAFLGARQLRDRNIQANERLGDIYASDSALANPRVALEYYAYAIVAAGELGMDQKVAELRNKIDALQPRLPVEP